MLGFLFQVWIIALRLVGTTIGRMNGKTAG